MIVLAASGASQEAGRTGEPDSADVDPRRGVAARDDRTVAVYAAVVRRLVTRDHTFGAAPSPFKRVFIVDGVVEDAADPRMPGYQQISEPFARETKEALLRELGDLPVAFVGDPNSVIVGEKTCPRVRGDGVLISLGLVSEDASRVTVANGLFFACEGGQWLTYVLEGKGRHWRVTGTTGPVAIS